MPQETMQAVQWAYTQTYTDEQGKEQPITKNTPQPLVDAVRSYFNSHSVIYNSFSYSDLQPYL